MGCINARIGLLVFGIMACWTSAYAQGPLIPPGPPGPTMKTLDQLEPRVPIRAKDLPLTITNSGSYYLTETIKFTDLNTTAITIATSNVRLDLGGFSLIGPGKDQGFCGSGIAYRSDQNLNGISIRHGQVTNWRGHGIHLDCRAAGYIEDAPHCENVTVVDVTASFNGIDGIRVGEKSLVAQCHSSFNGHDGIYAHAFSLSRLQKVLSQSILQPEVFGEHAA